MKKIISLLFICLLLTACSSATTYQTVDDDKVVALLKDESTVIVDVREIDEYNTGHIKNAINIPVDNISSANYDLNTTIIVYCASGMRSEVAAKQLISMGYTNVYNLDGGLINWGFELEE